MKKKSKKIKNARALPIKLDYIKPVHLKKLMFKMVVLTSSCYFQTFWF